MIRGTKRPVTRYSEDVQVGLHNRFDIEVRNTVTGELRQKAHGLNVILNQYYTGRSETAFNNIWYGSGSGTPAETDTGLFAYNGKKGASDDGSGISNIEGVAWRRLKVVFSETEAVGVNFSEVGLGGTNKLYTHAMLQDMNGNPVTILKTNTDILTIYATVYAHWNIDGYANGKIIVNRDGYLGISSVTTNAAMRILSGAVLPQVCTGSGRLNTTQNNEIGGLTNYVGTANGIGFRLWLYGEYPIVGEAVGTGDGVTQDFALDFDLPESAKVYVDGVEQTEGVTVYPAIVGSITRHFVPIAIGSTPNNLVPTVMGNCVNASSPGQVPEVWLYNPYASWGLYDIGYSRGMYLYICDDLVNWYSLGSVGDRSQILSIPAAHRYDRFFKLTNYLGGSVYGGTIVDGNHNGMAVHFDTPPAAGAVITADYTTPCVPKDENHVLDWSVSITLGRYEGET